MSVRYAARLSAGSPAGSIPYDIEMTPALWAVTERFPMYIKNPPLAVDYTP